MSGGQAAPQCWRGFVVAITRTAGATLGQKKPEVETQFRATVSSSSPQRAARIERLYCEHREALLRLTGARNRALAEDAVQDLFAYLLTWRGTDECTISRAYLAESMRHLIGRTSEREAQRRRREQEVTLRDRRSQSGRTAAAAIDSNELAEVLASMPSHLAEVIRLAVCQGISYQEVASALGVEVGVVNNWRHRGVESLRRGLCRAEVDAPSRLSGDVRSR